MRGAFVVVRKMHLYSWLPAEVISARLFGRWAEPRNKGVLIGPFGG